MHTRLISLIAIAAGTTIACAPVAHADDPAIPPDAPIRTRNAGYVYINARTGERTLSTAPILTRSEMLPLYVNEDAASNGNYFWGLDSPTRRGREMVDWGDIAFDTVIDAYAFAYSTTIVAPDTDPNEEGVSLTTWWCNCDNGINDPDVVPVWSITVENLQLNMPGPTYVSTWIYTIDLAGTDLVFELGDTDGSFIGTTGEHSTGCDKDDTDGFPKNDFSWSYSFNVSPSDPVGIIGPLLVLPPSADISEDDNMPTGAGGNADGDDDLFDVFMNPDGGTHQSYVASLWFGGWPRDPYASSYMGLYGSNPRDCGPADFNADTTVDVLDFLDFINDFSNCENQPAPCGTIANTDLGGDTIVDILDFLDFMDVFAACE